MIMAKAKTLKKAKYITKYVWDFVYVLCTLRLNKMKY